MMSHDTSQRIAQPHPPDRRAILVAEDDDAVREFVRIVLEQANFRVSTAPNGRAAGDLFEADPLAFDMLLTDVVMPLATGVELAARVRAARPELPVLFMSAFPGSPGLAPCPLPPGTVLLEKPFSLVQLIERVRTTLAADEAA
ncbi:Transcriptional activator protein CopR [Gemmata obscuriglobus]|uniref:response regulator n=1 Tax=Gemmata obscuriglobus TaxID=114 RepID=UPI00016C4C11|nr:response regulator [Gemmata obscuriglobus]QEG28809.1 Transcriptional activator protein CopR [Gemmata obscuriglobus]VTS07188.1 mfs transporter : Sensory box histidine kinase/response regulator (Partial) OS=Frankia alni (strain ACN14a) GN=FRAAL2437 PE=4 SV=1: Response_reg [Gemmata obscuriglobus UQM 2246]